MNNQEKHKYAYALTSVASTGLSFIEDSLSRVMNNATDMAYLRSFYILLSYNFELILKSRVVMLNNFSDKNDINDTLRKLGHDITKISEALVANLEELGIKEITENGSQYKVITTDNKEIYVENFTKIRYDFLDNVMRNVDNQEHERIKKYTKTLTDVILRKAKQKNEEAKNQT
ncbi:MAG: hypothetical protein Q7R69_01105 [bacterium]|nr:hypothetical protein [bacterium]